MPQPAHLPTSSSEKATLRYLPRTLIDQWLVNPEEDPVWGQWLSGSLMHCDVTGFTAMSEALAKAGKEGAEMMAHILNRFFERMISLAAEWGGIQMKFGGDAMLLYFHGEDHATRAAACGMQLQKAMREFHRVKVPGGETKLRMRIGIHSGKFYSASVGVAQESLHYLLIGKDVNECALTEPMAEPGEVVISEATFNLLDERSTLVKTSHEKIWKIKKVNASEDGLKSIDTSKLPIHILKRYLMKPIADGMTTGLDGENRRAVIVFIDLHGAAKMLDQYGGETTLGELNTYMEMVLSLVSIHGGYLAASDVAEEGDKLIILFSAPVSIDLPEASAMRFAIELRDALLNSDLHLSQHIGINSGYVFAGEIGSRRRREYTVIGDSVNLSARLMAAADMNTILVSAATASRADQEFELEHLQPIRVKGKSQPIDICRLQGLNQHYEATTTKSEMPFMGRDAEMARLKRAAKIAENGQTSSAYVCGVAGIGKSRLCDEFYERMEMSGWMGLNGICQRHTSETPYSAWRVPLRMLFGMNVSDSQEVMWEKLKTGIIKQCSELDVFAPLVADVLSIQGKENPVVKSMDSKTRHERRISTITKLLNTFSVEQPILLMIEDVQWIDGPSCELINVLLSSKSARIMVCLNSRTAELPADLADMTPGEFIELQELPADVSQNLLASFPDIDPELQNAIVDRANGNPLFINELIQSKAVGADALPETVYDVIMARLDQLSDRKKEILRLASVIGHSFEVTMLRSLFSGTFSDKDLSALTDSLAAEGFIIPHANNQIFEFNNNLAWEVVYETLLYAERRRLHCNVAECIEAANDDHIEPVSGLLAHHYEQGNVPEKIIRYSAVAGDYAASMFANDEAVDYYNRALERLSELSKVKNTIDQSILIERIGDVQQATGHEEEAERYFNESIGINKQNAHGKRAKYVCANEKINIRESVLCRKISISYARRSEWNDSLKWIDQAFNRLPDKPGSVAAQICATKCGTLIKLGETKEAINWGKEAIRRASHCKDIGTKAHARNALALSYNEIGEYREAIKYLLKAIELYEELGDYPGLLSANTNLGNSYEFLADYQTAEQHFKTALDVSKQMDNMLWVAIESYNLAGLYIIWGKIEEAINYLNVVIMAYKDRLCSPGLAGASYIKLCYCALARGSLEDAEKYINQGKKLLETLGAPALLAEAELQHIELLMTQGEYRIAKEKCKQILMTIREIDAKRLKVKADRLMAICLVEEDEIEAATIHIRQSIDVARKIGAELEEGQSLVALAKISIEDMAGFSDLTRKYLDRAIEIFTKIGASLELEDAKSFLQETAA